jgi:alcohol dehydrogenase (cytochrome c)
VLNQRFSPLEQIDPSNVGRLKAIWRTHLGSALGPQFSGEAQPLVHAGIIYIVTGASDVFALDVRTGAVRWKHEGRLPDDPALADAVCCGWTSRGVALGEGKVFVATLDAGLVALDQRTGKLLWRRQVERYQDGFTITSAPLYFDGIVVTGLSGSEKSTRGRIKGYRARDGAPLWTFYTIPGPGEFGHDTWPSGSDLWKYGGASVWQTPALDPDAGLLYFQAADPAPTFNGAARAGDNLFSSSIVAIDALRGTYRWHFQFVHHDIWDYSGGNPIVLFDAQYGGQPRKGLALAGKTGWVYLLDRLTGKPLLGIEERPVLQEPRQATASTQPFPIGDAFVPQEIDIAPEGFRLENRGRIFTPFWTDPIVAKPAPIGGATWPPSSFDPRLGRLFVCATDRIQVFRSDGASSPPTLVAGQDLLGGSFGVTQIPATGIFAAIDVRTNRLVWQQRWPEPCYSGSTATASGLVFVGRSDGRFTALHGDDGRRLWEFQTGAGVNAPPAVFEHDGEQLVVVYSAGNLFARSARGDSVWLFGLRGALEPVGAASRAAPSGPAPGDHASGRVQPSPEVVALYARSCRSCHGARGEGAGNGPALRASTGEAEIARIIAQGRNEMPAFRGLVTESEIRALAAYVVSLASGS